MLDIYSKLKRVKEVFDVEKIISIKLDNNYIEKYYLVNRIAYSVFQSSKGYIHVGITRDGKFKPEDLIEPVKFVNSYISKLPNNSKVLELATGRASNSLYLAQNNPSKNFYAMDLSDGQLKYAYRNSKKVHNLNIFKGDYHNLSQFEESSIDICFIVEALCYSTEKRKVLDQVSRILKPNGLFIVIDGYLNKEEKELNKDILLVNRLVEVGMAVPKFEVYTLFRDSAEVNYNVEYEEDISREVVPSMLRLEKLARVFFKNIILAKILSRLLPHIFVYNSLSGYFMPNLIEEGIASYMITVLRKK